MPTKTNRLPINKNKMLSSKAKNLIYVAMLATVGCGSSDSSESAVITPPVVVVAVPTTPSDTSSMLHAEGSKWVDAQGSEVQLKGINLGNWLLQEFWMMGQSTDQVNDQCTLEKTLTSRFGYQEKERLMKLFHDNWITEKDWDIIADFDLNLVRIPFIYSLIEDENNPMTLRADAWDYLDLAVAEAEKRGMYVILDLHGAVGSQGWEHHSGCAGLNQYWDNEEYQQRTQWLWQQIAEHYKDNDTIAGYGLLNEPWGTTEENLAMEIKELYDAVREIDQDHIIILPGHHSGIDGYGDPAENGMDNVAFEMHFYPGIFGWGEPGYEVHRDWLRCGENGAQGVCQWQEKLTALNTPFLNGEFQPWASLGELSGYITRASYDTYAELGWASTAWSYKVFTNSGGQGSGTWGLVTNVGLNFEEKLVAANTWACAGWQSDFSNACDTSNITFTAQSSRTAYLVVKTGALDSFDISYDSLSLIRESTDDELITNGEFGSNVGWNEWQVNGSHSYDFSDEATNFTNASGASLHITGDSANGGLYQAIALTAGETYTFSGVFQDNGSVNAWTEVFLVNDEPITGTDVTGTKALPQLDFNNASIEEIEQLFISFSTTEYDVLEEVQTALTAEQGSPLFDLPSPPTGITLVEQENAISLSWDTNSESNVTGYNVYRSTTPSGEKTLLAENLTVTNYTDNDELSGNRYYVIAALDPEDISYFSEQVTTYIEKLAIPGKIEAEAYSTMSGMQFENTTDTGGGQNSGFADPDDFLTYQVNVESSGTYTVTYRLATETGSTGFKMLANEVEVDEVAVPATGGWQSWTDISTRIELTAGEQTLKLLSVGKEWNLNWITFVKE